MEAPTQPTSKKGSCSFAVAQVENGYLLRVTSEPFGKWIFRSAEELAKFIATEILGLPH